MPTYNFYGSFRELPVLYLFKFFKLHFTTIVVKKPVSTYVFTSDTRRSSGDLFFMRSGAMLWVVYANILVTKQRLKGSEKSFRDITLLEPERETGRRKNDLKIKLAKIFGLGSHLSH